MKFTVNKPTYLNLEFWPASCLIFCVNAFSFSVHILLEKCAWKTQQNLPSNSASTSNKCCLDFCAFSHRNLYYMDCNKCSRTTLKLVTQKYCRLPRELCCTVPWFMFLKITSKFVPNPYCTKPYDFSLKFVPALNAGRTSSVLVPTINVGCTSTQDSCCSINVSIRPPWFLC